MGWPERTLSFTIGLTAFAVGAVVPVSSTRPFACVVCRLKRVDSTYFGAASSDFHESECSRWYRERVDLKHDHAWERGTFRTSYNLFGRPVAVACSDRFSLASSLPSSRQLAFYQHVEDPKKAAMFFESLADETPRDDRVGRDRSRLAVEAVKAWEAEGFPGTWEEWRSRFCEAPSTSREDPAGRHPSDDALGVARDELPSQADR
jgi:hypothetical protein